MLPLSRIVSQRSPWQMYTLATRPTRLFGVGHVSCCTRIKLIAGLTRFTGVGLNRSACDRRDGDGNEQSYRIEVVMHVIDVMAMVMDIVIGLEL